MKKNLMSRAAASMMAISAFVGFAAADGDLVTPLWEHNLTSENDTAKFSSDGTIVTNGQCLWLTASGKLLGTFPASGGVSISAEYQNYFRAFCPLFSGDKVAYSQLYDNDSGQHIHAIRYRSLEGIDTREYYIDTFQNACDLAVAPNSDPGLEVAFPTWLGKQTYWIIPKGNSAQRRDYYGACHVKYLFLGSANGFFLAGKARYHDQPDVSPYPFDCSPDQAYFIQSASSGLDCYANSDGHLVWHKDIANLGSLNISCLSDNATFAYNTKDAVTGEITAHFADVVTGVDKGTSIVPAPVVAASPADNTLLVQWSWGGLFDPGSAHYGTPGPTALYSFDPETNTCSFLRNLAEVEPSWVEMRTGNMALPAGTQPVVVATQQNSNTISVRRASNGSFLKTLPLGSNQLYALSPDGQYYAVNTIEGGTSYLEIRRTTNGAPRKARKPLTPGRTCNGIFWAGGNRILVEETHVVRIYEYNAPSLTLIEKTGSTRIAKRSARLSPDGSMFAFRNTDINFVDVHDAGTGALKFRVTDIDSDLLYQEVRFTPTGQLAMFFSRQDNTIQKNYHASVKFWDVSGPSPTLVSRVDEVSPSIVEKTSAVSWDVSPDGQYLAIGLGLGQSTITSPSMHKSVNAWELVPHIQLFRISDGAQLKDIAYPFSLCANPYLQVAFSPDGHSMEIYSHPVVYSVAVP